MSDCHSIHMILQVHSLINAVLCLACGFVVRLVLRMLYAIPDFLLNSAHAVRRLCSEAMSSDLSLRMSE
jgi:hypothetical protein